MRFLLFFFLMICGNTFADKVKLERPYELNSKEFSILKNQLYSCVDESKINDDDLTDIEIETHFFISQLRFVWYPKILNEDRTEIIFGDDGITILDSKNKKAANIVLEVFNNPDCKRLFVPIGRYDDGRDLIFSFNFREIQNFYKKKQSTSIIIVELPGMKCAGDSYDGKLINGLAYCKEAFANWYVQMNDNLITGVGLMENENERVLANFYGKKFDGYQVREKNDGVTITANIIDWGQHTVGLRFGKFLKNNLFRFDYYLDEIYTIIDFDYDMGEIYSGAVEQYYFDKNSSQYVLKDNSFAMYYKDISQAYSLSDIITPEAFANAHLGKINSEGKASGPVIEIENFGMSYFYVDENGNWESVPTKDFRDLYGEEFDLELEILSSLRFDIKTFWDKVNVFLSKSSDIGLTLDPIIEEFSLSDEKINQIKKHYSEYISKLN